MGYHEGLKLTSINNLSKDSVLAVKMRGRSKRDEELRAVRILAGIGHAERALAGVLEGRHKLILELAAVNRLAATAGTGGVTSLDHEALDDAMEDYTIVLAGFRERGEVIAGLMFYLACGTR